MRENVFIAIRSILNTTKILHSEIEAETKLKGYIFYTDCAKSLNICGIDIYLIIKIESLSDIE